MSEPIAPSQRVLARFVRAAQEGSDGSLYYFYGNADLPDKGSIKLLTTDNKPALSSGSHPTFAVAEWGCQPHWGKAE